MTEVLAPIGEATKQVKSTDELGSPFEILSTCRYCWGQHPGACPYIKVVEWHPSGQIARVVLKERPEHEKQVAYAGEEDDEMLKRSLIAITQAHTLKAARDIAATLLEFLNSGEAK